jgi:regulatory protein YycI of two-component signal transduction system YycFG
MNFKRIQWIFLVAFLIFDVVVASTLLVQNRFTVANSTQNRRTMIIKEMRGDAISSVPLSNRQATGYYLSGSRSGDNGKLVQQATKLHNQNYRFSSGELISDFEEPVKIDPRQPEKRLNQVIKNNRLVVLGQNYRYNPSLSDKNTIVYAQTLAGRPLYSSDGQLRFHVNTNHEVTGYTQTYLENMQILRPQAATISQQHAVTGCISITLFQIIRRFGGLT